MSSAKPSDAPVVTPAAIPRSKRLDLASQIAVALAGNPAHVKDAPKDLAARAVELAEAVIAEEVARRDSRFQVGDRVGSHVKDSGHGLVCAVHRGGGEYPRGSEYVDILLDSGRTWRSQPAGDVWLEGQEPQDL